MNKLIRAIKSPNKVIIYLLDKVAKVFPDDSFLKIKFRLEMGKSLNLNNPVTFNEKLQWLKLYNRKPEYTSMVDKYAAKDVVAGIIGKEYIIPTLGIWNNFDDIDFNLLPRQFVLKTTHGGGGGGVVICKDKTTFDKKKARNVLQKSLNSDIYWKYREWPYKDVPKLILAEKYMTNKGKDLEDFKIHCFNGEPRFILVCRNRYTEGPMIDDFYSCDWKLMNVRRPGHPNSTSSIERPKQLEQMLELSRILSKDIPFLRTDFYIIDDRIYFGELTFFPASGMSKFEPEEWDYIFGQWLDL